MNNLVKILSSDDGEPREKELQYWHLVYNKTGAATLCEGEFFGVGESSCEYETKDVLKGGITCPDCLKFIKDMKEVKL